MYMPGPNNRPHPATLDGLRTEKERLVPDPSNLCTGRALSERNGSPSHPIQCLSCPDPLVRDLSLRPLFACMFRGCTLINLDGGTPSSPCSAPSQFGVGSFTVRQGLPKCLGAVMNYSSTREGLTLKRRPTCLLPEVWCRGSFVR